MFLGSVCLKALSIDIEMPNRMDLWLGKFMLRVMAKHDE